MMRFLTLIFTTSLVFNNTVAGEGQLRGGVRRLPDDLGDTDPCLDLPGSPPCKTLGELVVELKKIVPLEGDEYKMPYTKTLKDWQNVIGQMLEGDCRNIDLHNYLNLEGRYKLYKFKDTTVIDKPKYYCVFTSTETKKMTKNINGAVYPWGTFITRIRQPDETVRIYNLSIDVPHPLADMNTYEEGVQIYKESQARSMYLAGSHRRTVPDKSDCGGYNKADASHNYQHPLTFTTMAVENYWTSKGKQFAVIQIHGKGDKGPCKKSDIFVADGAANTHGNRQNPGPIAEKFTENLKKFMSGSVNQIDTVKSNPDCELGATQNIQARFLNGMTEKSEMCDIGLGGTTGTFITTPNGKFLQIEQSLKVRNDTKLRTLFGDAIRNTFDSPEYYREA